MHRIIAAFCFLAAWVCLWVGAVAVVIASEMFGLGHIEGTPVPSAIYGLIPGPLVALGLVSLAVLSAPILVVMIFHGGDQSQPLYWAAAVTAVVGFAILPDKLGEPTGCALIVCGGFLATAGWLTHQAAIAPAKLADAPAEASPSAGPLLPGAPGTLEAAGLPPQPVPSVPQQPVPQQPVPQQPVPQQSGATQIEQPSPKPVGDAMPDESQVCPWCSTTIAAGTAQCPSCHAMLTESPEAQKLPGLTEVDPALREYARKPVERKKASLLGALFSGSAQLSASTPAAAPVAPVAPVEPSDRAALKPPNDQVRLEMERIMLELSGAAPAASEPGPEPGQTAEPAGDPATTELAAPPSTRPDAT